MHKLKDNIKSTFLVIVIFLVVFFAFYISINMYEGTVIFLQQNLLKTEGTILILAGPSGKDLGFLGSVLLTFIIIYSAIKLFGITRISWDIKVSKKYNYKYIIILTFVFLLSFLSSTKITGNEIIIRDLNSFFLKKEIGLDQIEKITIINGYVCGTSFHRKGSGCGIKKIYGLNFRNGSNLNLLNLNPGMYDKDLIGLKNLHKKLKEKNIKIELGNYDKEKLEIFMQQLER